MQSATDERKNELRLDFRRVVVSDEIRPKKSHLWNRVWGRLSFFFFLKDNIIKRNLGVPIVT